jgi:hypothetical protein
MRPSSFEPDVTSARSISMAKKSRLNLSCLPHTKFDMRDCAIRLAFIIMTVDSSLEKPKSRNTFPLDLVLDSVILDRGLKSQGNDVIIYANKHP